jgi:hypothetical protein
MAPEPNGQVTDWNDFNVSLATMAFSKSRLSREEKRKLIEGNSDLFRKPFLDQRSRSSDK